MEWLETNVAVALTLGGLAVYGVQRYSYDLYYQRLSTTPEEVGFGYTQILGRSVVGFVVLLVITFGLAYGYWLVMDTAWKSVARDGREVMTTLRSLTRRPHRRVGARAEAPRTDSHVVLALVASSAILLVASLLLLTLVLPGWVTWGLAGVGVVLVLAKGWPAVRMSVRSMLVSALVALVLVSAFTVLYTLEAVSRLTTLGDHDTGTVSNWLERSALAPRLDAPRALVEWAGPPDQRPSEQWSACVYYLGTSNGTSIFYDAGAQRGLRLPASSISVLLFHDDC